MIRSKTELIRYLENYHEVRCALLAENGKKKDAQSIYYEIVVDKKDPKDYLFVSPYHIQ